MDDKFILSEEDITILQLQEIMRHSVGEDKCALCKAINQLQQPADVSKTNDSWWVIILFLLIFSGSKTTFDRKSIDVVLETLKHQVESEREGDHE